MKTLKDLEGIKDVREYTIALVNPEKLRQEVIKDIIHYQVLIKLCSSDGHHMADKRCLNCEGNTSIINYIKWKFNISEEDLK